MPDSIDPTLCTPEAPLSRAQFVVEVQPGAPGPAEAVTYVGGDYSGQDFSGRDLSGCDFSGANLRGARFVGASLRGATLFEVDAEGAEFVGADLAGAILRGGGFVRAGFGSANLTQIDAIDADFSGATFSLADLTDANLVGARAADSCWREVKLGRADLRRSDLSRADLTAAELGNARFDDADLSGAILSRVRGFRTASWIGVDAATLHRRGACFLHDFIEDQNFLAEYRNQGRSFEWTYRIWWLTSDCGRSVVRWACCSAVIALLYTLLYTQVGVDYGRHATWLSPFYFSVVTLTTLGYGDVVPATMAAQVVVISEVVVGYVMLGGLISLISNKLSRRAS